MTDWSTSGSVAEVTPASKAEPSGRHVMGLDIGGANLKAADTLGHSIDRPFALWRTPERLAGQLRELVHKLATQAASAPGVAAAESAFDHADGADGLLKESDLAVTMTGELADCFASAAEGVRFIAKAVCTALPDHGRISFYGVDGRFASLAEVCADPHRFAASNWHALAAFVANEAPPQSLLIDIGSTTCDLISLDAGRVNTASQSDFDRLCHHELVYVGFGRTPVCAVVDDLPIAGRTVPVMNEVFATTGDCALILGLEPEDVRDTHTADGRPRTVAAASARLARMVGLDADRFPAETALRCSRHVLAAVRRRILAAIDAAPPHRHWVLSGHGQALLGDARPDSLTATDLRDTLGPELSRVAPAYAVARLRSEPHPRS